MYNKNHFVNRELSWLDFNERVLQEAESLDNPLIERIRFLGINIYCLFIIILIFTGVYDGF